MIPSANQAGLVAGVVEQLTHAEYPSSCVVVTPPGFGEESIAEELRKALERADPRPLVAVIAVDQVRSPIDYVIELHRQWSQTTQLGPAPSRRTPANNALAELLAAAPPARPAIQIVKRFHKFLDTLDQYILAAMRTEEQPPRRLRSANFSPLAYADLKRRWTQRGTKLINSNYGDFHSEFRVAPLGAADAVRECIAQRLPSHVAQFVVEQTGAYPEACQKLIGQWRRRGAPEWSRELACELSQEARRLLRHFADRLDDQDRTDYLEAVVAVHRGFDDEQGAARLREHPWADVILEPDDGGLRSVALGDAAAESLRERLQAATGGGPALFEQARSLYERGRYRDAFETIEVRLPAARAPAERLLGAHAEAMALLVDAEDGCAGLDTDWQRLKRVLAQARAIASDPAAGLTELSAERLAGRHAELEQLADGILGAARDGDRRLVDRLSGCGSANAGSPRTALWLLIVEERRASAIPRRSAATQAALALPEQILRVWAQWALGLDQNQQPSDCETTWEEVRRSWPRGKVPPGAPLTPFVSLDSFAWFAWVLAEQRGIPRHLRFESSTAELESSLSFLQVRRDHAHALARSTEKDRQRLFALLRRWLDPLFAPCTVHEEAWSRDEFEALLRPLPLLAGDGTLEWLG